MTRPFLRRAAVAATLVALPLWAVAADTVATDNPYGLSALWAAGDFVAKATLVILVLMSMGSWYVIVTKLLAQARLVRDLRAADAAFFDAPPAQAVARLAPGSVGHFIADTGVKARADHADGPSQAIDLYTWLQVAIQRAGDRVNSRLQEGLSLLGTVGATAPFVGLFGTVWGIYHALTAIGVSGQASIDKVAGPVGEALIMTAIGLAVAVPAVLGYNFLVRRNKVAMEQVRTFGHDLHGALLGSKARRTTAAPAPVSQDAVRVG